MTFNNIQHGKFLLIFERYGFGGDTIEVDQLDAKDFETAKIEAAELLASSMASSDPESLGLGANNFEEDSSTVGSVKILQVGSCVSIQSITDEWPEVQEAYNVYRTKEKICREDEEKETRRKIYEKLKEEFKD